MQGEMQVQDIQKQENGSARETAETVISVRELTKIYKLYNRPKDRFWESLGLTRGKVLSKDHYALRKVSFDVHRGETVGIIGPNGSGKSTILKIITGVLSPTQGTVTVNGRISALLELGAGFNTEYSGLENIYLNGTMIGFSREEIDARLQDILDFADIGEFIHQPVKTYSSGMFVRLAFAVAINIDPEILIVDEALSVGDVFFQAKCYRKFEDFKDMGKTILFVSHDLSSIRKYCDRVILLNKGDQIADGKPGMIVDLYKKLLVNQLDIASLGGKTSGEKASGAQGGQSAGASSADDRSGADVSSAQEKSTDEGTAPIPENVDFAGKMAARKTEGAGTDPWVPVFSLNPKINEYGDKKAEIIGFNILDQEGNSSNTIEKGTECTIQMKVLFHEKIDDPIYAFTITDLKGTDITGTNSLFERASVQGKKEGEVQAISFRQRMDMQGGEYMLSLGCTGYEGADFVVHHRLYEVCNLTIVSVKNTVGFYDTNSVVTLMD